MLDTLHTKTIFVVGGPNGSGKTTLAKELLESQRAKYISADDIAFKLNPENPHRARIQAGKEFFKRLRSEATSENNIIVESTLSGKSLLPLLSMLRNEFNYAIVIAFIYLADAQVCAERVSIRVQKGGHFVALEDIQRRFNRSVVNFWQMYRFECDAWHLFYNSNDGFLEVARSGEDSDVVLNEGLFTIFKEIIDTNEQTSDK